MATENPLESIERRLDELTRRIERIERLEGQAPSLPPSPVAAPPEAPGRPERPAEPARRVPEVGLEELLGGRVLAWVGAVAILLGIVFFLGMAIRRGWIDEPTRTVLALLGSTALLLAGCWLHERKGQTEAALAAVAAALSGLYATLIVATRVYELISGELGLGCAGLVGVVGAAIAVRWASTIVAAIGILGALLAPVLVGAGTSGLSLAFMAIALSAAVGVLLWQKWDWLALGAFLVSVPQLVSWIDDNYAERLLPTLAVLAAFWALYLVAAIGYELRVRSPEALPVASWGLLLGDAVLVAGAGYLALDNSGHPSAAIAWILLLAAAHIMLGASALRQAINREIGSLLVAVGLGLSALGFADALDGPVLVAGWAAQAVVLAQLASRASVDPGPLGSNAQRLLAGSAWYLALAFAHVGTVEAPPEAIFEGVADLVDAAVALALSAAAAFGCAYWFRRVETAWAGAAEVAGAAALVYLASVAIIDSSGVTAAGGRRQAGQVWLSAFWAVTGLAALVCGLLRAGRRLRLGGLTLIAIAIVKVYTYDLAELDELARVASFIALGLLLLAGAFAYQRIRVSGAEDDER